MGIEALKNEFCFNYAEKSVLSLAMKNMDFFYSMESKMAENDFLNYENSLVFSILKSIHRKDFTSFDIGKIVEEAKNLKVLKTIGGQDALYAIYKMPVDERNFDKYVEQVIDSSTKLKLYLELEEKKNEVLANARDGLSSNDLISAVDARILELSNESKAITEPKDFTEGIVEWLDEKRKNKVEQSGVSSGFPILDKQIDGMIPGTLFIIAARKKMGKSAFLTTIARHVAFKENKPVLYVDTELTYNEWRTRVIAALTGIDERIIKHGGYTEAEYVLIRKIIDRLGDGMLFHEYMPGYTVDKLVALYRKYKAKHNIGMAVFDYIKEPDSSSLDAQRKEYQVLGDVTTKLKDLSGKLDIPFLTAVQLNRANDIADSDRIARYGDIIAFWAKRDEEDFSEEEKATRDKGGFKLVIKDTRRGGSTPSCGISYYFQKTKLRITEVEPHFQPIDYTRETINYGSDDDILE